LVAGGKGDVGRRAVGGEGGGGVVAGQEVGRVEGLRARRTGGSEAEQARYISHDRTRWPEHPQPRQRTGSLHLRTLWRGERQRKHPLRERRVLGSGVFGGDGTRSEGGRRGRRLEARAQLFLRHQRHGRGHLDGKAGAAGTGE
jgi:hypothetical protein